MPLLHLMLACSSPCDEGFAEADGNCYPIADGDGDGDDTSPQDALAWGDAILTNGSVESGSGPDLVEWMDGAMIDADHAILTGQGGWAVIDAATAEVVHLENEQRGYSVDADQGFAAISTRDGKLIFVDVSDPANPRGTGSRLLDAAYHEDISVDDGRILVAYRDQGALMMDDSGMSLGTLDVEEALAVGLHGDRAVVADGDELVLFDVSSPSSAIELDRTTMASEGRDIDFDGSRIAVGLGGRGAEVYGLESDTLVLQGSLTLPGSAFSVALDEDYLWIGAWEVVGLAWLGGDAPVMIAHEDPTDSAMGLAAGYGRAVVADWFAATAMERVEGVAGPEIVAPKQVYLSDGSGSLKIANGGYSTLDVELSGGGVTLSESSLSIEPGASTTVSVSGEGGITVTSNDPDEAELQVNVDASSNTLGSDHPDFDLQGFVYPDSAQESYSLRPGEVTFLAYFALY